MSHNLTVEDLGERAAELISALGPGDEITLLSQNRTVARIIPAEKDRLPSGFGACKGMIVENPDVPEDAYLEDFKDYL